MSLTLGIDPGLSGGLALHDGHELVATFAMPTKSNVVDGASIAQLIRAYAPACACIESVTSRPRQAGVFNFGFNTGVLHGVCMAEAVPVHLLAPAKWKRYFGLQRGQDESYKDGKNASRALAAQLFPEHAKAFARVKDDGVAEAALIALYGAQPQPIHPLKGAK